MEERMEWENVSHMSVDTFSRLANMRKWHPDLGLKLEPCSAIISEASTCNRWEKYRDSQPENMQRVKDLGTLSPKLLSSSILPYLLPTQGFGHSAEEEVDKQKNQRGWRTPRKYPLNQHGWGTEPTETWAASTGPTWLCTRLGPISERRSGHIPPSLTQKLPLIDNHLQIIT